MTYWPGVRGIFRGNLIGACAREISPLPQNSPLSRILFRIFTAAGPGCSAICADPASEGSLVFKYSSRAPASCSMFKPCCSCAHAGGSCAPCGHGKPCPAVAPSPWLPLPPRGARPPLGRSSRRSAQAAAPPGLPCCSHADTL